MAYASGGLIEDIHYNGFADSVNNTWTTLGTADVGYGQSGPLSMVANGTTVTAAQWNALRTRIRQLASHQGSTVTMPAVAVGGVITANPAVTADINTVSNNRRNAVASGTDITAGGVVSRTTAWVTAVTMTYNITFASFNAARYFFNAGGQIRMGFARTGGTSYTKNTDWSALCTACGTVVLTGGGSATIAGTTYTGTNKIGGSGSPITVLYTTGFHQLTTTAQTVFLQRSTSTVYGGYSNPVNANNITITARKTNATGNVIEVVVRYNDLASDSSGASDQVSGTLTTTMVLRPPSTTHLTNSWGTPTMSGSQTGS